ncbi:RidA family protein [Bacteroidota bacterium]|jgi:enamine deaminase RidA (YjgF/YER057c/UK114 family)
MKPLFGMFIMTIVLINANAQTPEQKLIELGITLPNPPEPVATYVTWRRVGNMLYIAGIAAEIPGQVGKDLTIEQGYEAAKQTGIQILSVIKSAVGELNKVKQFVRVHGMVNSAPNFYEQPKVMNGFSDLMLKVFGEKGLHARAAVGNVLPDNFAVEIEVTLELVSSN